MGVLKRPVRKVLVWSEWRCPRRGCTGRAPARMIGSPICPVCGLLLRRRRPSQRKVAQ